MPDGIHDPIIDAAPVVAPLPILTAAALLAVQDRKEEVLAIPEWGGSVRVRALSKGGLNAVREACTVTTTDADGKPKVDFDQKRFEGQLLLAGLVEPQLQEADLPALFEKAAGPLDRISEAIARVSGLGKGAVNAAKS